MNNRKISNLIIANIFLLICTLICILILPTRIHDLVSVIKVGEFNSSTSTEFETVVNSEFPNKNYFIDVNGLAHRLFLQREMNEVILLENGHETQMTPRRDGELVQTEADSIIAFSDWLGEQGIEFLYVQIPGKIDSSNALLPAGKVDYSDELADELVSRLYDANINVLDIRKSLAIDGIDRYSIFLNTEHHWKPEGGFYGFTKICSYLRDSFGETIPEEVTDLKNYNIETYKGSSLGYYGQRTGWIFAGGFDDFSLIYPKWETVQSLSVPHNETYRKGSFYDTIFNTEYLEYNWRKKVCMGLMWEGIGRL